MAKRDAQILGILTDAKRIEVAVLASRIGVSDVTMADCLAAIKKLVFEEGRITQRQLWDAILDDFRSPEGMRIQRMLANEAPKYGNDDDYVDDLVVEAYDSYIDEIGKYPNTRYGRGPIGGIRYAGTSSISANVGQGMLDYLDWYGDFDFRAVPFNEVDNLILAQISYLDLAGVVPPMPSDKSSFVASDVPSVRAACLT